MNESTIYYRTDVAVGDRVVTTQDVRNFDEILPAGSVGTVVGIGSSHHTQNGGGFDVEVAIAGRRWSSFAFDEDGHFRRDAAGRFATKRNVLPSLTIRSSSLELV